MSGLLKMLFYGRAAMSALSVLPSKGLELND